jgi:hypothetical protein
VYSQIFGQPESAAPPSKGTLGTGGTYSTPRQDTKERSGRVTGQRPVALRTLSPGRASAGNWPDQVYPAHYYTRARSCASNLNERTSTQYPTRLSGASPRRETTASRTRNPRTALRRARTASVRIDEFQFVRTRTHTHTDHLTCPPFFPIEMGPDGGGNEGTQVEGPPARSAGVQHGRLARGDSHVPRQEISAATAVVSIREQHSSARHKR